MPIVVLVLVILGFAYQLFFRYDHWVDSEKPQVVYERDNLTGETRITEPGEKVGLLSRLTGGGRNDKTDRTDARDGPFAMSMLEEGQAKGLENKIPEPGDASAPTVSGTTVQSSGEQTNNADLNQDGQAEQIMVHKTADDGLLDISILQGQREVFYARGKNIQLLPTRKAGWADVSLTVSDDKRMVFRYNPETSGYEVVSQ